MGFLPRASVQCSADPVVGKPGIPGQAPPPPWPPTPRAPVVSGACRQAPGARDSPACLCCAALEKKMVGRQGREELIKKGLLEMMERGKWGPEAR